MKTCIIIPVHNEGPNIGSLVRDLKSRNFDIVVIDDGSTDQSGRIAQEQGAFIISHESKRGKGVSLRDGFEYAIKKDYDVLITMDGDRQHAASDVDQFLKKTQISDAGIITGTRMQNLQGMPFIRIWTNRLMSWMISLMCRQKIPDTQCGFRLIRCEVLKKITLSSEDFQIETEVLIQASRQGYTIESIPIQTIYGNESSKINPVIDTIRFFVYILKELISTPRQNRSK